MQFFRILPLLFAPGLFAVSLRAEVVEADLLVADDLASFLERSNCDTMDPTTVCGGEPAAPPSRCIFSDTSSCSGKAFGREKWAQFAGDSSTATLGSANASSLELNSVVALINDDAKVLCSGTIISDNIVLTADHCIGAGITYVFVGSRIVKTSSGKVAHDGWLFRTTDEESFSSTRENETCKRRDLSFDAFDNLTDTADPDIGLVYFDNGKSLSNEFIDRIETEEEIYKRLEMSEYDRFSNFLVAGFGASEIRDSGGEKRFAYLGGVTFCSVSDDSSCRAGTYEFRTNGFPDTCFGDSGGLAYGIGVGRLGGYLLGAVSRAAETGQSNLCGKGGVYTSIYAAGIETSFRSGHFNQDVSSILNCSMPWLWILDRLED